MTKKTIYTAIFGPYDDLKEPRVITPGWRHIVYTDQELKSDVWEIRKVPVMACGTRRTARYYKIMAHQHLDADMSIWLDASFIINCNLDEWVARFFQRPMTMLYHPDRRCVYQEAKACIKNKRDNEADIKAHIRKYKEIGVPSNAGMVASGLIMRQHTDQVRKFCELWYHQLLNGCARDQISWAYANWRMPITKFIGWNYGNRTDFIYIPHFSRAEQRAKYIQKYRDMGVM